MKIVRVFTVAFILFFSSISNGQYLDSVFYPTNNQLETLLRDLETAHPNIIKYFNIGISTRGNYPIMCLKISDNTEIDEDEPAWIFTGIIHGREQIGLRVLYDLSVELSEGYNSDPDITNWINAYEIYFVFSINPWGYEHNSSGSLESTGARKNGSNSSDGNSSGVDLNRNYGFRWNQGGSTDPVNSKFRGMSAFSENETKAIRDLYLEKKPVFGITFHQGNDPDGGVIMRPWGSSSIGAPPDANKLVEYAQKYADWVYSSRLTGPLCLKNSNGEFILEDPDGLPCGTDEGSKTFCSELCWKPSQSTLGAYGQSSNWYYSAAGTIDLTVEVSDRLFNETFMHSKMTELSNREQSVLDIAKELSLNHREAIKSWFNNFLYSSDPIQYSGPGITGTVIDSLTGEPISAVISVQGFNNSYVADRTTNSDTGRFWKLLPTGSYNLYISALGYEPQARVVSVSNNEPLKEFNFLLTESKLDTTVTQPISEDYILSPIYPNPINKSASIELTVKEEQNINVELYDVLGRRVKLVSSKHLLPGQKTTITINSSDLSSGLYFLHLAAQKFNISKAMTIIK